MFCGVDNPWNLILLPTFRRETEPPSSGQFQHAPSKRQQYTSHPYGASTHRLADTHNDPSRKPPKNNYYVYSLTRQTDILGYLVTWQYRVEKISPYYVFQHSEQTEGFCHFASDRRAKQRISLLTWVLLNFWLQSRPTLSPSICQDVARYWLADGHRRFGVDILLQIVINQLPASGRAKSQKAEDLETGC